MIEDSGASLCSLSALSLFSCQSKRLLFFQGYQRGANAFGKGGVCMRSTSGLTETSSELSNKFGYINLVTCMHIL